MCLGLISIGLFGCHTRYIPNTSVESTDFNRSVIAFCERYRHAVEEMNMGLVLALASPRYFDNNGTPLGDDDIDKVGLEDFLHGQFSHVKAIRYEFKYRDVYKEDMKVCVDYTYTVSFQFVLDGKLKWSNKTADNRLELESVDGGFLILSGM